MGSVLLNSGGGSAGRSSRTRVCLELEDVSKDVSNDVLKEVSKDESNDPEESVAREEGAPEHLASIANS